MRPVAREDLVKDYSGGERTRRGGGGRFYRGRMVGATASPGERDQLLARQDLGGSLTTRDGAVRVLVRGADGLGGATSQGARPVEQGLYGRVGGRGVEGWEGGVNKNTPKHLRPRTPSPFLTAHQP